MCLPFVQNEANRMTQCLNVIYTLQSAQTIRTCFFSAGANDLIAIYYTCEGEAPLHGRKTEYQGPCNHHPEYREVMNKARYII